MTNVEKLKKLNIIGDVRQRLGAKDENDEEFDKEINDMDSSYIIECWSGWNLGHGSWWTTMKYYFDELEKK